MVISIRPTVRGIEGIFVLPILLSCVFFRIRMVITAAASTLSFYLLLVFTHAAYQAVIELRSVVAVSTVILAGGLIAYNVISRGRTALEKLQKSLESTQELKISNALMEKLSKIDALTKVNNHRAFQEYVAYILTYTPMKDFHLAIIDIDDFKKVNDTYGHQIGDTVLKATALIIQDTVSENDFVARYGGEEFVVVFFEKTSEEAIQLAEEIRLNIARHHFTELDNGQITISLGLSSYKSDMSKDSWFKEADHALYEAKKNGKNQIIVA
jgi:diguanylate cyclase (GGDEF)-like protein